MSVSVPILLINFNRPDKTRKLLELIQKVQPKKVYFAVDGPRTGHPGDRDKCKQVQDLVDSVDGSCKVKTLFQHKNLGCGIGPVTAINWLFEHEEYGIILEDDCLPDLSFFLFCEELLKYYEKDCRVMQISGSNFFSNRHDTGKATSSYFFSSIGSTWGWATWRRAWKKYDYYVRDFPEIKSTGLLKGFFYNKEDTHYVLNMIQKANEQEKSVTWWDYQWDLAKHLNSGLSIVPVKNLIKNIGFSSDATHTKKVMPVYERVGLDPISFPLLHPKYVVANANYDEHYFKSFYERNIISKIKYKLKKAAQPLC